jgi:hypothetical protein
VLSPTIFRAFVGTVVPDSSQLDESDWTEFELLVANSLSDRPLGVRLRVRLFTHLVQWLPLVRYRRPFTSLDSASRQHFLTDLQNSEIAVLRVGLWGLRTLAFLGFYGRSEAREAIGYRPDPRGWDAV